MINDLGQSIEEDIKKLSEENHALLLEVHRLTKKINRHMIWDQVMSIIKITIIIIPLWYGYTMLAPQLKQAYGMYSSLLGGNEPDSTSKSTYQLNEAALKNLSPEVINQLIKSGIIK